ncbi:MAG: type VI secretion system protein TssA [Pseudomonadota bacterium]|nr:MAG: type VI secretion system protein TssA [Pseudomonadota bacterium]
MALDLAKLLEPISPDQPAGPNLEYDSAFAELERTAQGKPEQQIGNVVVPAEPPEWGAVFNQARTLLTRTKDLRVAVHLAQAAAHREGLPGLAEGLHFIRLLLEQHWDVVHPQLDPEDDNDPTMRVTALAALAAPPLLFSMRSAPLLSSRSLGPVSLRDLTGEGGSNAGLDTARIEAAFAETPMETLQAVLAGTRNAAEDIAKIEAVFDARAGVRGPELSGLLQLFRSARQALESRLEARTAIAAEMAAEAAVGADGPATTAAAAAPRRSGEILSREDVVRVLDQVIRYYERNEPSSPIPLLLERCKRLVPMSFPEILKELTPDGLKQLDLVAGKRENKS